MKIFKLIAVFCLLISIHAQAQWIQQDVPGNVSYLNSINFTNVNSGITTGWGLDTLTTTRAYYTTNGGTTWIAASVPDSSRVLVSTQYITSQIVYGTGAINTFNKEMDFASINNLGIPESKGIDFSRGAFFKSTNGGATWVEYGSMPADCYHASYMEFVNANTGMCIGSSEDASGAEMNILKTTNGGLTWTKIISDDDDARQYNAINYVNENLAFTVGYDFTEPIKRGIIMRTTNGGINWTTQYTDSTTYTNVFCTSGTTGFITGGNAEGGHIWKTTNQGETWNTICTKDSLIIQGIKFYNAGPVGIAYGVKFYTGKNFQPFALKTTDFGATWKIQIIDDQHPTPTVTSGCMVNNFNYYLGGGTFSEPRIYHTNNGGSTLVHNNTGITAKEYSLKQNYPNPFNPVTSIQFNIPSKSNVTLKVFNSLGKEIVELMNEVKSEGSYEVKFDAANLPSGVYYYKLSSDNFSETKKMILLK